MGILDGLRGRTNGALPKGASEADRLRWQMDLMEENLRQLETAAQDGEWRELGTNLQREFTRAGLDDLVTLSRAMYLSHPLIQRAVNITTYYTWGQGVEFNADERIMDEVIGPMVREDSNQMELYSHQARLLTDVDQIVDGNIFIALFKGKPPLLRSIPSEEIRQIHRNPDDRNEVWFYRREWGASEFDLVSGSEVNKERKCLYPDIGFDPQSKPDTVGGIEVKWDAPVIHQKVGGLKQMAFGVPGTYAALDWARAYKKFLEDWHTIVSSLARFSWKVSTKGSKVASVKQKMSTAISDSSPEETNPSMPAGSAWIGTPDDQITPIAKTGAHTSSDDARPSRLMVGAAMDLPDTILSGDADVGNLATAKSLDRPTELAMASRQMLWSHFHQRVFGWAIEQAVQEGRLSVPEDEREVKVSFPPIIEHDQKDTISSIISAATLDGKIEAGTMPREELARMLMTTLGVENVQEQLDMLDTEDRAEVEQAVERLREVLEG